jgi:hypothetical protein
VKYCFLILTAIVFVGCGEAETANVAKSAAPSEIDDPVVAERVAVLEARIKDLSDEISKYAVKIEAVGEESKTFADVAASVLGLGEKASASIAVLEFQTAWLTEQAAAQQQLAITTASSVGAISGHIGFSGQMGQPVRLHLLI